MRRRRGEDEDEDEEEEEGLNGGGLNSPFGLSGLPGLPFRAEPLGPPLRGFSAPPPFFKINLGHSLIEWYRSQRMLQAKAHETCRL